MPIKIVICDTPDDLAAVQYFMMKTTRDIEMEVTTESLRSVEIAARTQPDVVVTELTMGGLGGAELIKRLRASAPAARIVCWTASTDPRLAAQVLAAGASGYVVKDEGHDELLRAVRQAADGGVLLSPGAASMVAGTLGDALGEIDELREELATIKTRMEEGTAAKADFLANISHEVRTPVTVAKGIAYVLRNRDIADEERLEFIDQLQTSLDKLMMMVDEIITIAELERGTLELNVVELDLAPLVRQAVDEIARQYPSVAVDQQIPTILPAHADPARVAGVIREILDNACRYSPEGRHVEIRARALEEGVVVSVTDHGQGMHRDVTAQAFDQPFSTGEATLRKEKAGVGVGLHLAHQLIVEHGGIMWADPLPSGGTRVSFCLPAHEGERIVTPPQESAGASQAV
jgi:signal transduction histidine kinase